MSFAAPGWMAAIPVSRAPRSASTSLHTAAVCSCVQPVGWAHTTRAILLRGDSPHGDATSTAARDSHSPPAPSRRCNAIGPRATVESWFVRSKTTANHGISSIAGPVFFPRGRMTGMTQWAIGTGMTQWAIGMRNTCQWAERAGCSRRDDGGGGRPVEPNRGRFSHCARPALGSLAQPRFCAGLAWRDATRTTRPKQTSHIHGPISLSLVRH